MKKNLFFIPVVLGLLMSTSSAFALEYKCKSIYRKFTGSEVLEQKEVPMVVTDGGPGADRLESEINDQFFSAIIDKTHNNVLMNIVKAPDYTTGNVTRTSMADNYASTSQITEEIQREAFMGDNGPEIKEKKTGVYTLYKIECYAR